MKKMIFLSGTLLTVAMAKAQPVMTASNYNPVVTESVHQFDCDTAGFNPGASGAGVSWNFASLSAFPFYPINAYASSSTPYTSSYPGADLAMEHYYGFGEYDYFDMDVTGQYFLGGATGTYVQDYSNPVTTMQYPFTYLSIFTDTFYVNFPDGVGNTTLEGTIKVTGDSYGTLTLATGIFNNVLRTKSTWTVKRTTVVGSSTFILNYQLTFYHWITPGTHFPLLTYSRYQESGSEGHPGALRYIDPATVTIGINEFVSANEMGFDVYPNPVSNGKVELVYQGTGSEPVQVNLINVSGQISRSASYQAVPGNNRFVLDISGLAKGIYLVEIQSTAGRLQQKLVIK